MLHNLKGHKLRTSKQLRSFVSLILGLCVYNSNSTLLCGCGHFGSVTVIQFSSLWSWQWASNVKRKIEELSILPSSMSDAILSCNVSWSIFFLVDDSAAGISHEKSPPQACLFLITWPKKEGTWNVNVACELKHKVKSDESWNGWQGRLALHVHRFDVDCEKNILLFVNWMCFGQDIKLLENHLTTCWIFVRNLSFGFWTIMMTTFSDPPLSQFPDASIPQLFSAPTGSQIQVFVDPGGILGRPKLVRLLKVCHCNFECTCYLIPIIPLRN